MAIFPLFLPLSLHSPPSSPTEDPTYCVDIQSFPDYVKRMHQQRQKGFEKEYDVSYYIILLLPLSYYVVYRVELNHCPLFSVSSPSDL